MDLTVDPQNKVASYETHTVISTRRGVSIICPQCGYLRNMFPYDGSAHGGILATGEVFRHCYCTQVLSEQYPVQMVR